MALTAEAVGGEVLRSALRKARWRLIPLLSVCYLVAFMDRANISFAAETMNRDLHFTPRMYGLGAGLFFLTYALFEIPSSRMLLRFGARRWLARIMLTWGLLAAAMVLIRTPWSFYTLRMLLGLAEAGYFPGAIYFMSLWFPASERSRTIAMFYVAYPLSSVVMGGLAGVLLRQNGRLGMAGWQWLFLVEALPAVVLSAVVWSCLTEGPETASWLSGEEREALRMELEKDSAWQMEAEAKASEASGGVQVSGMRRALTSGPVWMIGLYFFFMLGQSYAVGFFLPLMLRGLTHWNVEHVGFLIAGFGAAGAVAMVVNAHDSDKRRELKWHIMLPTLLIGVAYVGAGAHLEGWGAVALLGLASTGYFALLGPTTGLPNWVFTGEAGAVAIAVMTMCGIAGGFVGPYLTGWLREATGGYAMGVGVLCLPCVISAGIIFWLMRRISQSENQSEGC